jgi:hypothetical protein
MGYCKFSGNPEEGSMIIRVRVLLPPIHREWSFVASRLKINLDSSPLILEKF